MGSSGTATLTDAVVLGMMLNLAFPAAVKTAQITVTDLTQFILATSQLSVQFKYRKVHHNTIQICTIAQYKMMFKCGGRCVCVCYTK